MSFTLKFWQLPIYNPSQKPFNCLFYYLNASIKFLKNFGQFYLTTKLVVKNSINRLKLTNITCGAFEELAACYFFIKTLNNKQIVVFPYNNFATGTIEICYNVSKLFNRRAYFILLTNNLGK